MLKDVLATNGLMAVSQLDPRATPEDPAEPPCPFTCVGAIKAYVYNPDGTANIVLHGLTRARVIDIARERPYRLIRVAPVPEQSSGTDKNLETLSRALLNLLTRARAATSEIPPEALEHIEHSQDDPAALADTIGAYIVNDVSLRRSLLECPNTSIRLQRLRRYLRSHVLELEFEKKLRGGLPEDGIGLN